MKAYLDSFGKVMISFGGVCTLGCKHCYTMTKSFSHAPRQSVQDCIEQLLSIEKPFSHICVSGDTDPLLDQEAFRELIFEIHKILPEKTITYTSRLIPDSETLQTVSELNLSRRSGDTLIVPAVSLVTHSYPNQVERKETVPSSAERILTLERYREMKVPCIIAMRPIFPFSIVPRLEIDKIVEVAAELDCILLGETFIVDPRNEIGQRLAIEHSFSVKSPLTFIDQPGQWLKGHFLKEEEYLESLCRRRRVIFFMRSSPAIEYLHENWDSQNNLLPYVEQLDSWTNIDP